MIKRILKILSTVVLVFILLLFTLYILLLTPKIQTFTAKLVTNQLSKDLGADVSLSNIRLYPLRRLIINDFLIKDKKKDTLIYISSLSLGVDSFSIKNKKVHFGLIKVHRLETKIITDSVNKSNFQFIINSFVSDKKKTSENWNYSVRAIKLEQSNIEYINADINTVKKGFDVNHVKLKNIYLYANNFKYLDSTFLFRLNDLKFTEQCGLKITDGQGLFKINKKSLGIYKLLLTTPYSYINIHKLAFYSQKNNPKVNLLINLIKFNYVDLQYIIGSKDTKRKTLTISGDISGKLNDLKGKNISFSAGKVSELNTDFNLIGLPKVEETFLFLNIHKLKTNYDDIVSFLALNERTKNIKLSESLKTMGTINFKGNISGFLYDLVTFGNFKTELGNIKTDVKLKLTDNNTVNYEGKIETKSFNFGKLLGSENNLNNVSLAVDVNGYKKQEDSFNADIKGVVDSIYINSYKYNYLSLNANISNKQFNGKLAINDENINAEFNGMVNWQNEIPQLNFIASVKNAYLSNLKIMPELKNSILNMEIEAKLKPESARVINGEIKINKASLYSDRGNYKLDRFNVISSSIENINTITIDSDMLRGTLIGNYSVIDLMPNLKSFIANYLPTLFSKYKSHKKLHSNYELFCKINNFSELLKIVYPQFMIADNTILKSNFDYKNNIFDVNINSDSIRYKQIFLDSLNVNTRINKDKLENLIYTKNICINNNLNISNLSLSQLAENDSVDVNVFWDNSDLKTNKGAIYSKISFNRDINNSVLYTKLDIKPSYIYLKDSIWNIKKTSISFSKDFINVNTFRVHNANRELSAHGIIYKKGYLSGDFSVYFNNITIDEVNNFVSPNSLILKGLLNGSVNIKNTLESPVITSNINVDKLIVNKDSLGQINLITDWENNEEQVNANIEIVKNNHRQLSGSGFYKPKDMDFNFDFDLDSLQVGFLNLYLDGILNNINGTVSGKVSLHDTPWGIGLAGKVNTNKIKFDVGLINCSYSLEDSVFFTDDIIDFRKTRITDVKGNKGVFEGTIYHHNFLENKYNLLISADNMLVLNTKPNNNELYYGKVYASGDFTITGTTDEVKLDINASTEPNTKFYIPLSNQKEDLSNNFIQFVNSKKNEKENIPKTKYNAELNNYTLNMEINANTGADVNVIFDPSVGDVLKANGKGNLKIGMDKQGNVSFFGGYEVSKGSYMFAMENIVNKKFDINSGGTIRWNGSPYEAIIDITAIYKTKTSIQPLLVPSLKPEMAAEYNKRVPVDCKLLLSGNILQPKINFDITTPTMDNSTKTLIKDAINTNEELNRQVLSLLIMNKFYTPDYNNYNEGGSALAYNTTEMLTQQLSDWLSKISNDLDIGIRYRPQDQISNEQLEVALSTQIFNNRVTLNGNVEYGNFRDRNNSQRNSNIVGDFDIEVKLNKKGTLKAKAYTHSNDNYLYENSPYTQGVSISYGEDFNTLRELVRKYWYVITGRGKKIKKQKED